jgi:hypothetical protein
VADRETARRLVEAVTGAWEADSGSDVVWAGDHEGRRGVRMRQTVREFTTVWFDPGDLTVGVEAYVLSLPPEAPAPILRQCLRRNAGVRRLHFALDRHGDLLLVGRIPVGELSAHELDLALAEAYQLVEQAFPSLSAALREKNP